MSGRLLDSWCGVKETFHYDRSSDLTTVSISQDCQRILDNNKELENHTDGYSKSRELRRVASIPLAVYEKWMREDGVNLMRMPKEEKKVYLKLKLDDPDWKHLNTAKKAQPYQRGSMSVIEAIRSSDS